MGKTKKFESIKFKWGERVFEEVIENNIELSQLTPDEIKDGLNRAVGKFAFYGSMRADAKRMRTSLEIDFDAWEAGKFAEIQNQPDYKKGTAGTIKAQIIVQNVKEWKKFQNHKATVELVCAKLQVLTDSFELMTRTLQSCLAMLRAELSTASMGGAARGSGDILDD